MNVSVDSSFNILDLSIVVFIFTLTQINLLMQYFLQVKTEMKKEMKDLMLKHYGLDHEVTFDVDHLQTQVHVSYGLQSLNVIESFNVSPLIITTCAYKSVQPMKSYTLFSSPRIQN